ncbi:hypothetical protein ES708_14923 [subsurface metagenome]
MITHVKPVPHIFTFTVNGDRIIVLDIIDGQGNEFLGELVGTVIVGTVRQYYRQFISMVIGSDQVIGTCLGCGVGTPRIIRGGFCKIAIPAQ